MNSLLNVRADFPILQTETRPGVPLVYLDSAASSQKPTAVIEAMNQYYQTMNANVHRGIHHLSETATNAYEASRDQIATFINAPGREQIIFVRNATEGMNLIAYTWARANLRPGDVILTTEMEHHANIVPWQIAAQMTGATVQFVPFTPEGQLDREALTKMLTPQVKLFAFTAASNVFGTLNPVRELVDLAHAAGAIAVVDAAQAVPHAPVDVQAWDCDFMTFSGHKMCGPTGSGVLFGKLKLLEEMPPFMGGGDMIRRVTVEKSTWNELPYKFEAGTPSIAEGIGLGAAVAYLSQLGMANVHAHEQEITRYALAKLQEVPHLHILGPLHPAKRGGLVAFTLGEVHPHDLAQLLDEDGIAIRAGHHCAMPLHHKLGLSASARASFYLHTTPAEIDFLVQSLHRARKVFGV